jgi:sortase A
MLMWAGIWLIAIALLSSIQLQGAALAVIPPDAGPVDRGNAPDTTDTPLAILPESPLPSGQESAITGQVAGVDTGSPTPESQPLISSTAIPMAPNRLVIPAIKLDAPIQPVGLESGVQDGQTIMQWQVPNGYIAGWLNTSAAPGTPGNTVLDGHHNIYGQVFRYVVNLKPGDLIYIYTPDQVVRYAVSESHILPEKGQPLAVRIKNAEWIQPTADERLTLVTCWPYTNNTHRLIVVARPAPEG